MASERIAVYRAVVEAVREVLEEYDMPDIMRRILLMRLRASMAWYLWVKRLPVLPGGTETVIVPRMREMAKRVGVQWWWMRKTWRG